MVNEVSKITFIVLFLAIFGSTLGIIFSPLMEISSKISIIAWAFVILAIAILLIAIGSFYLISFIITKLTTYRKFISINSNIYIARRNNFISIFFWNFIFGVVLSITIIFFINTIFPFENPGDIDYALITSLLVIPGLLLSLRLLTNPVKKKPMIPIMFLWVEPNETRERLIELKERTASFYHSFIQTALFTVIILYSYLVLKAKGDTKKLYTDILTQLTPTNSFGTFLIFLIAYTFAIFLITFISETLLETYEAIIQED